MEALTQYQKQFATDNHDLIYRFLNRHKLGDDYYDTAALALCKAVCAYDAERSCFTTFAYSCMKNEIASLMSKDIKQAYLYYEDCDPLGKPFIESISSGANVFDNVVVNEFFSYLCDTEKKVLFYLMNGMSEYDISEILSCTQQYISKIRRRIQSKWTEYKSL